MSPPPLQKKAWAAIRGSGFFVQRDWPVLAVRGSDAVDLLQRLSTNDLAPLQSGLAVTTLFLTPTGRLFHRVLVQPAGDGFVAIDEPCGSTPLVEWIDRYTFGEDVQVTPFPGTSVLVVGPRCAEACAGLETTPRGFGMLAAHVVRARDEDLASTLSTLRERDAVELDEPAYLQLRVFSGVPAGGAELTEERHPLEAGLIGEISFTKGCYVGQEVVARQDTYKKVARRLVQISFPFAGADQPAPGELLVSEEQASCVVTSVAPDPLPLLGKMALGYVRTRSAEGGGTVRTASGLDGRLIFPSGEMISKIG